MIGWRGGVPEVESQGGGVGEGECGGNASAGCGGEEEVRD